MKKECNLIDFTCTIKRERFNSDSYKIYLVDVDKKVYPNIKTNLKGEIILVGSNFSSLIPNLEYKVKAYINIHKTFGVQYEVKEIKQDKPTTFESSKKFLDEILTKSQSEALLSVYPNIIDKIIKDDLGDIDLNKVKGIKEHTFNKIKTKVIENFALIDIVDLFDGLIPINVIKKLYDEYHNVGYIKKILKNNPYKTLCRLSRIGFKSADKILLELDNKSKNIDNSKFEFTEDLLTSKQRMKACVNYILEQNESDGNTRISIKDLRSESNKLTPQCINHFVDIIKDNDEDIYVNNELKYISSAKAINSEEYICDKIIELNNTKIIWNIDSNNYRKNGEFDITDEQLSTINVMCNKNIGILTAPAGSGKTASVKNLLNALDDNKKTYMLCTPTGKSSEVLEEQSGREAGTIHRQLNYSPLNCTAENGNNPWGYNENNKLDVDLIVVDEFSMVDIYLFKHLLEAIDTSKTKLLLVFDSSQLPSVGCGNIAQDLLDSNAIPIIRLTKIFRYNEGGLMQVATKIRNGEQFLSSDFTNGVKVFGTKKDFIYLELQQQMIKKQVLKIYSKLLNDGYSTEDIIVLCCQNKGEYGTFEINKIIQYMMQKEKNNKFLMYGDNRFFKDDKVMQIVNNYRAKTPEKDDMGEDIETEIYNGNTGIIVKVNFNNMIVDYGKGKLIKYTKAELNQLQLGYCISDHKSQGDSFKQVICVSPKSHSFMMNSNLLYVGVTRARERVYMLGNIITINKAIKKKANFNRDTWLKDLMKNTIDK